MIKTNERNTTKLVHQQDALMDYIGALTIEIEIENLVIEKQVLNEPESENKLFTGSSNVSPLNAVIEEYNRAQLKKVSNGKIINQKKVISETKDDSYINISVFFVSGLKLAIAADKISRIVNIPSAVNILEKKIKQNVYGLLENGSQIVVINTSALVIPNVSDHGKSTKSEKIIIIKGSNIGFTCDAEIESLQQNKNAIRWRTDKTKRRWLAGTVVSRQMALLDIDRIIEDINIL